MALRSGWRKLLGRGAERRIADPYWDFFINTPPADPANALLEVFRKAPEGNVFPTKADLHTPEVATSHVKEIARYLGADLVGVTMLDADDAGHPFAIVCAGRADDDPCQARGIGGQVPVQNGLFVTFVLSAWIRELGFRASMAPALDAARLAASAKLGMLDRTGKLVTAEYGTRVHVADVIRTDLPLTPAQRGARPAATVPYAITRLCTNDRACVEICPVACIHTRPGAPQFYIDPDVCIDCEQCEIVCPVDAIFKDVDVPAEHADSIDVNASFFRQNKAVVGPVAFETAWQMVHRAHTYARSAGIAVTAAVVDEAAVPIAVGRMDGAAPWTAQLAVSKAYTAAAFHLATADLAAQARQPWLLSLLVAHRGRLLPAAGGLVIFDGITIIGAVGVAGGDATEQDVLGCQAALAVLETGGHRAPPSLAAEEDESLVLGQRPQIARRSAPPLF